MTDMCKIQCVHVTFHYQCVNLPLQVTSKSISSKFCTYQTVLYFSCRTTTPWSANFVNHMKCKYFPTTQLTLKIQLIN
uniref:Uncharacterized protein n=1 Tax=Arundo donax TaxID=35708 RepID=A0A0A9DP54_ARUDO